MSNHRVHRPLLSSLALLGSLLVALALPSSRASASPAAHPLPHPHTTSLAPSHPSALASPVGTQFAIFYELVDLASLAGSVRSGALPNALKNRVVGYWNGGLKDWASAPFGVRPGSTENCPLCRRVVLSNPNGNLADFIQLLRDCADALGGDALYLKALADDMAQPNADGAMEPWP